MNDVILAKTCTPTNDGTGNIESSSKEFNFIKLQDAMGTRFIPVIAGLIIGNNDPRPFIDNLNILEKNGAIDSAEKWQELRNLRNRLAHEYPENTGQTVDALNILITEWTYLREMYLSIKGYFDQRLADRIVKNE